MTAATTVGNMRGNDRIIDSSSTLTSSYHHQKVYRGERGNSKDSFAGQLQLHHRTVNSSDAFPFLFCLCYVKLAESRVFRKKILVKRNVDNQKKEATAAVLNQMKVYPTTYLLLNVDDCQ